MSGFDKREQGQEAKFAHEEEVRFKATARRNHRLGLWAAGLMSLEGDEADAFAKEVIRSDFEEPGDDDVLRMVSGRLKEHGLDTTPEQVRSEMDRLMAQVMEELS